jgi:hypothetical protein
MSYSAIGQSEFGVSHCETSWLDRYRSKLSPFSLPSCRPGRSRPVLDTTP